MSDVNPSEHSMRPLYWLGNVAKTSVVDQMLSSLQINGPLVIFDYGCGDGGDWPHILRQYPHIKLIGYEPDSRSSQSAQRRLDGHNAEIHTGDAITSLQFRADFIVSFSVFEHVYGRTEFLIHAKRLLADEGTFFLNYDDGHFRYVVDLARPSTWGVPLREWLRSTISPPMAALGITRRYQRRVIADEVDLLIATAGFSIQHVAYHNLACLKQLFKTIHPHQREVFVRHWLEAELALNGDCAANLTGPLYGDRVNLWQHMPTRTLCLRHRSPCL